MSDFCSFFSVLKKKVKQNKWTKNEKEFWSLLISIKIIATLVRPSSFAGWKKNMCEF